MLAARRALLGGVPGWVLRGASIDLAFANSRYYGGSTGSLLTCSRAQTVNSYALKNDGTLVSFASNILRITDLGLLDEDARTNVALWSRDMTNAAWTKTSITAALDQTGADGTANAASSLTATGANGTCLQAITLASSARFQSVWAKRITGAGTINMTMDNGVTWTAIVLTSSYQQLTIPTQTLANPTVGFRIVTSGDAIAVDFAQNENSGTNASSPIATTTASVARAADSIATAGLLATAINGSVGSIFAQTGGMSAAIATSSPTLIRDVTNGNNILRVNNSTQIIAQDPTTLTATLGSGTLAGVVKHIVGFDSSGRSLAANNGTVATDANTFAARSSSRISDPTAALNSYLQRLTVWNARLPDATLKALTQ